MTRASYPGDIEERDASQIRYRALADQNMTAVGLPSPMKKVIRKGAMFPLPLLVFFLLHWQVSVFFQSFFLHRYVAHRMFTMSRGWERFFQLCTYLAQGSSYLRPEAYAILHRTHHAYADAPGDPHSPRLHKNVLQLMLMTKRNFEDISQRGLIREPRFAGNVPVWKSLDAWGASRTSALLWVGAYTAFYACFATAWWQYLLLPFHFLMGPMHGSIVNWFGHWAGYRNFETDDCSRNSLVIDVLTCGELYQNNHHRYPGDPNFAKRWFELDLTYPAIRLFHWLGVIQLRKSVAPLTVATQPMASAGS